MGGGHHRCEWCDAKRARKREEKDRRDIRSIKEGKYWRHSRDLVHFFFLTWWLFGEGVSGLEQMEVVTAVTHSRGQMESGGLEVE